MNKNNNENHELPFKRVRLLTDKYEKDYNVKKGYEGALLDIYGNGSNYGVDIMLDKKGNSEYIILPKEELEIIPFAKKKDK